MTTAPQYTTGAEVLDAFVRLVRAALPELDGRVTRAQQKIADAPGLEEPRATVGLSPMGPAGHPLKEYPHEAGTLDATTGATPIRETIDIIHRAVIAVTIIGDDAQDLYEQLEAMVHSEVCAAIVREGHFSLDYAAQVSDQTELDGDRWRPQIARGYQVTYTRQDVSQSRAIERFTTTAAPALTQET